MNLVQAQDRIKILEQKLEEVAKTSPGLNEKVEISVNEVRIQEFLRGLANSNGVNLAVAPDLNIGVINNFSDETLANILVYLCKEYELDIDFTGSILSIKKYNAPLVPIVKEIKPLKVSYRDSLLTLELEQDTLEKVIKKITQLTTNNVILAPDIRNKQVRGYYYQLPVKKALENMAYSNGLALTEKEKGIYIIGKPEEHEKKSTNSKTSQNNRSSSRGSRYSKSGQSSGRGFDLVVEEGLISLDAKNASVSDIINELSRELDINYFQFSDLSGSITANINNKPFDDLLSHLLQETKYTYKKEGDIYVMGERNAEGLRDLKVVKLQHRSVDDIVSSIPSEIKEGVEVHEFKELNSIILSGYSAQITEIENFISQIDQIVPVVLIEVILLDIRKGKSITTGITAGFGDSSVTGGGTLLPGVDFIFSSSSINQFLGNISAGTPINLGTVTPDFYLGLSAIDNTDNAKVRSMPKLATLNGHAANLSIGSTRYYSIETQNLVGTQNPVVNSTVQYNSVQANLSVNIEPVVSGNDQVTLDIDVQISDFIGDPPANAPPPSATSSFQSMIRVKNDEMIVLGGIERIEKSESGTGIPYLSRIPILKWFFSSKSKSKNETVSIIFIKPTIVY